MNLKLVCVMALGGALVVACGDSGTGGSGGSGGSSDGGSDTGGTTNVGGEGTGNTINVGGMGQGGGTTIPGCFSDADALLLNDTTVATDQNLCDTGEADGFLTACLSETSTETTCNAYIDDAATQPCAGCILGADFSVDPAVASGETPVLISGNMYTFLNLLACESAAQGLPQCANPTSQFLFCAQTACESCDIEGTEYGDCLDYALGSPDSVCVQTVEIPAECDPVLNAKALSPECDGDAFEDTYANIAEFFCGAP